MKRHREFCSEFVPNRDKLERSGQVFSLRDERIDIHAIKTIDVDIDGGVDDVGGFVERMEGRRAPGKKPRGS